MCQVPTYEMRVLTLKRWALPHTISLKRLPRTEKNRYGDYIAFHNFHFIDIDEAVSYNFSEAYKLLKAKRDGQNSVLENRQDRDREQIRPGEGLDTSIRQSLTLLGRKTDFWSGTDREELFISLIQLQNIADLKPEKIEEAICGAFKSSGGQVALYFSLDYCDVVLFTKGISFSELHGCLWNLLFAGRRLVRDSVTIFCYQYDYLLKCLNTKKSCMGEKLKAGPTISLAIDLNVLSLDKFNKLRSKLQNIDSRCEIFQITGHYDIRILLHNVTAWDRIRVIESMDDYCRGSAKIGFVNYELVPISEFQDQTELSIPATIAGKKTKSLNLELEKVIRKLYQEFLTYGIETSSEQKSQHMRVAELYRSLLILHKSRLSEEFVLSILPAMKEFQQICFNFRNAFRQALNGMEPEKESHDILERLYELHGNFFQALTMMVQCTMHSERQWIQAPAFNSTLFDIPPKLLAFYSAITYFATQELRDDANYTFSFLIVPDFRNDIYVRSITQRSSDYFDVSSYYDKLLLISFDEETFYEPSDVIKIICHEAAHHVGRAARCRDFRAEQIFNSVAMYILAASLDIFDCEKEVIQKLVEALGRLLLAEYEKVAQSDFKYFLTDISLFLTMRQALNGLFSSPRFKAELQAELRETLSRVDNSNMCTLARAFDDEVATVYFSNLQVGDANSRRAACDVLSGYIVLKLELKIYEIFHSADSEQYRHMSSYFEDMLQAYSEAYADMRMLELLGINDIDDYDRSAERYLDAPDPSDLQKCLRYNAVLLSKVCTNSSERSRRAMPEGYEDMVIGQVTEYVLDCIVKYLRHCRSERIGNANLKQYLEGISDNNAYQQIETINSALDQYRKEIIKHNEK